MDQHEWATVLWSILTKRFPPLDSDDLFDSMTEPQCIINPRIRVQPDIQSDQYDNVFGDLECVLHELSVRFTRPPGRVAE
jgi:hypothetical protein